MTLQESPFSPALPIANLSISESHDWRETEAQESLMHFPSSGLKRVSQNSFLVLADDLDLVDYSRSLYKGTSANFELMSIHKHFDVHDTGSDLVRDLRFLSGLTWERIADLVNVKPKSIFNWASGHPIAEKNLRRLAEIVAVLRYIDRGYGEANRDLLMQDSGQGRTLFSLLAAGEFDTVKAIAGKGKGRPKAAQALPRSDLKRTAPDHFGEALSRSMDEDEEHDFVLENPGKRRAKARRKGQ